MRTAAGATACLTSSIGFQALAATPAPAPSEVGGVTVTARPSVDAYTGTLQTTPQNVNAIPAQVLTEQAVTTVQEALKNVPGVTLNAGEGGTHGDNINLRGFPASDDFFLDGLRDTGFYTRDSFDLEALEVYKGPASTLFGRGSTGGVVNQVSKSPKLSDFYDATVTGGTDREARGTVDLNYALGDDTAVRLNAMGHEADVAGRDFVHNSRWGVAPSVAFGTGRPVSLTLDYLHQAEDDIPDYGIPFAFGGPVPVPRNTYYGLPSDDRTRARVDVGTARLRADVNDHVWFTDTARVGNYAFDSRETAAHWGTAPPAPGTDLANAVTFRDRPSVQGVVKTLMNDADLHFKFDAGPVSNHLVLGVEADREEAALTRFANQMSQIAPTPVLDPNPFEIFPGHQTQVTQTPDTVTRTISGLVEDTLDFGSHVELVGGVRVDRFNAVFDEPITRQHFEHTDTIASPRAALIYKPIPALSLYLSYGASYDPSAENLSLSAKTASLAPEKDETYEAGAKAQVLGGRLQLQAAVFQTQMQNARVGDPTNPTAPQLLAGDERVRGFEIDANGHLTRQIEVIAGYTYLDTETVKSTDLASIGKPLLNTAPNQANLWLVYEPGGPWKVGAGLNALDRRTADVDGTSHVPGYVTFDAMVSYRLTPHLSLQLNGYNLTDKYYFANSYFSSPEENHVVPGAGRTVLLTASFAY
ncbi:MAG TPA: TonB-dependent siderophore receptor [Caulobacteraceae bacterium]